MEVQHTIAKAATISGRGLFGGLPASVTFRPAPPNHGVLFFRVDQSLTVPIPASIQHVVKRDRRTTLQNGKVSIDTCEHCMSALAGLGVDNVVIEVEGPELPGLDGSAKPYLDVLMEAGMQASDQARHVMVVKQPVVIRERDAMIAAIPATEPGMQVVYDLDYPETVIGRQIKVFDLSAGSDYSTQIAPARTFVLETEAAALRAHGMGTHLTPKDVLVIGQSGPIGGNEFRFADEPVRHKIVDLIGDLYLIGAPIHGKILAYKSGHALNHSLVRKLLRQHRQQVHRELSQQSVIDIRRLSRMMPHRYPMLLIDRVVEIEGQRRAVGIKNVTINEPFFQGHYPGTPIMPGVLIVEAMAQLSGVLVGQNLQHTGRIPVLLSLDKVKLRRPVTPGDQLILEAEAIRVRSRIAHMRCRAFVADDLAAEAEIKFMLVDDESEGIDPSPRV